jgi:hypothetical protein
MAENLSLARPGRRYKQRALDGLEFGEDAFDGIHLVLAKLMLLLLLRLGVATMQRHARGAESHSARLAERQVGKLVQTFRA